MVVRSELTDAEVDAIFQALADATRRDILARVIEREQSVSAIAERYTMSFAAVQKHVAVLERALLVTKERRGREQIVHAHPQSIEHARRLLDDYERLWRSRIHRMQDILDEGNA
ncbi:ArsR family transcriptional regulator [Agromyces protaetiae]|uniref:ArsR family transcriptional regulator n=1 Tax=Agromyces protaetiae TaxID=2509455 RepID=A0A4V0YGZ5_9MICO|nr:metalloregulator ArsR/SmtB family transcription factor [Agromyces protaetiae]QAY72931.1 ArsR family transcriptional regulator [Agromyces protaetiae]